MITDVHSHAWSYPDHFDDDFRAQMKRARAGVELDLAVAGEFTSLFNQKITPLLRLPIREPWCLAEKPAAAVCGWTTNTSPTTWPPIVTH